MNDDRATSHQHRLRIDRWVHGGDGLAYPTEGPLAGGVVFVPGVVPGDLVDVRVVKRKKRWARAEMVSLVEASHQRAPASCVIQDQCGGCPWMVGEPSLQEASRLGILRGESLKRLGWSEATANARIQLAESVGDGRRIRTRLAYRVSSIGNVTLGYRRRQSHAIAPLTRCEVVVESINATIVALREHLATLGGQGEVTLVAGGATMEEVAGWVAPDRGPGHTFGPETVTVDIDQVVQHVDPRGFVQAVPAVATQIADAVQRLAEDVGGTHAVELFAGSGALTTALWRAGYHVTAYELDQAARARFDIRQKAAGVPAEQAAWHAVDLLGLGILTPAPVQAPDVVLLDPPRAGAAAMIAWLRHSGAKAIAYVSCDAATGFRDLAAICDGGHYEVVRITGFDMFPHTGHQEMLAEVRAV